MYVRERESHFSTVQVRESCDHCNRVQTRQLFVKKHMIYFRKELTDGQKECLKETLWTLSMIEIEKHCLKSSLKNGAGIFWTRVGNKFFNCPISLQRFLKNARLEIVSWYPEQPTLSSKWTVNLFRQTGYRAIYTTYRLSAGKMFPKVVLSCLAQKPA